MTLAQVYRQEGRQEGRQEALIGMIVDLLGDRIGPVPEGLAEAIAKVGDPEKLRSLVRRAASVSSFEEFAKGL